jgi:hypothetical protein
MQTRSDSSKSVLNVEPATAQPRACARVRPGNRSQLSIIRITGQVSRKDFFMTRAVSIEVRGFSLVGHHIEIEMPSMGISMKFSSTFTVQTSKSSLRKQRA